MSTFQQPFTLTAQTGPSTGPVASGTGINFNFAAAPAGSPLVRPQAFGVACNTLGDGDGGQNPKFSVTADATFQANARSLNLRLFRMNARGSGTWPALIFGNNTANIRNNAPDWSQVDALIQNGNKWFDITKGTLVIGIQWPDSNITSADFANMCRQISTHFRDTNGSDGKPFVTNPMYFEIWNEPDGGSESYPSGSYPQLFKDAADAIHGVSPTFKVAGPCTTFSRSDWTTGITTQWMDMIDFHQYGGFSGAGGGYPFSTSDLVTKQRYLDISSADAFDVSTRALPVLVGEYNIAYQPPDARMGTYEGAIYAAGNLMRAQWTNFGSHPFYGGLFELLRDDGYGLLDGGGKLNNQFMGLNPNAFMIKRAVLTMPGSFVTCNINNEAIGQGGSNSLGQQMMCWATKNTTAGTFGVMFVNYGGSDVNTQLALSSCIGLPASGASTGVTQYEVSNANPGSRSFALTITNGLANVTIPANGVTIISNVP